jgi:hypothetical protein
MANHITYIHTVFNRLKGHCYKIFVSSRKEIPIDSLPVIYIYAGGGEGIDVRIFESENLGKSMLYSDLFMRNMHRNTQGYLMSHLS